MRHELYQLGDSERHTFTATVGRFGTKTNYHGFPEPTILLTDITLGGKTLCDHVWFTVGKRLEAMNLRPGDKIQFDARVGAYWHGYRDMQEQEYCLKYPTAIRKVDVP